jgi:hypothetical protein
MVQGSHFEGRRSILKGVCAGLRIPRAYVAPQVWKADLGLIGAAKNASKPRAQGLLSTCRSIITSEGKAEAALIGLWGCLQRVEPSRMANLRPETIMG